MTFKPTSGGIKPQMSRQRLSDGAYEMNGRGVIFLRSHPASYPLACFLSPS
jgi:hypothetical protein